MPSEEVKSPPLPPTQIAYADCSLCGMKFSARSLKSALEIGWEHARKVHEIDNLRPQ